jgi:hypothetical protein
MKFDKPGSRGKWRFIHADQNGNEFGFHGVCLMKSPFLRELSGPLSFIEGL